MIVAKLYKSTYLNEGKESEGKKSEVDEAAECLSHVRDAIKWRRDANYDLMWSKLVKLYGSKYDYPELNGYQDVVAPNMLFSTVNVIVPGISVNYPKISVTARKESDNDRASVVETVANYQWQHGKVHEQFRLAVKDFVIIGHGWCKTTWSFEEGEREWTDQGWQDEAQSRLAQLEQALQQAQNAGQSLNGFPTADQVIASIPKMESFIKADAAVVERVSPFDMFIDPDATNLDNARWIAERRFVPIEKAQQNEDWDPKVRKALMGRSMREAKSTHEDILFDGERRGSDPGFAIVWEYYDLIDETVCTFAEDSEGYLSKPEDIPYGFFHPYTMICNYMIPDKLYPIGDVEAVAPLQMELALTRTQMINDRKKMRRMYMYRPDEIGNDGVVALLSGDDNAMISVESNTPFGDVLAPVQTTGLNPEFYNQSSMILSDIDLVSGVSEYQRGSSPEIRRTATEASMIQDGANARSADKLSIVERSIGNIAEKVVKLTQQFLSTDQVARIVGPDGSQQWVQYTKDDLYGEWDFQVEAGSTMPQNESSRRQSAMQLMDAMSQFVGAGVVDPKKLAEHVLRMGFGIKNPEDFMMPMQPMGGQIDPATGQPVMPPAGSIPPAGMMPQGMPQQPAQPPVGVPAGMPPM